MPCENYREALTEAATAGDYELSSEVRGHLDACSSCRAFWNEERQLFATIDVGVKQTANAEVPASLLRRVRAEIDGDISPRRSFLPHMVFAAAALCAMVVLLGMLELQRNQPAPQVASTTDRSPTPKVTAGAAIARSAEPDAHPARKHSTGRNSKTRGADRTEAAVLLPAGQKEAVDKLIVALQSGAMKPAELIAEKAEISAPNLPITPLVISPIEIKPLSDVSEEPKAENE